MLTFPAPITPYAACRVAWAVASTAQQESAAPRGDRGERFPVASSPFGRVATLAQAFTLATGREQRLLVARTAAARSRALAGRGPLGDRVSRAYRVIAGVAFASRGEP